MSYFEALKESLSDFSNDSRQTSPMFAGMYSCILGLISGLLFQVYLAGWMFDLWKIFVIAAVIAVVIYYSLQSIASEYSEWLEGNRLLSSLETPNKKRFFLWACIPAWMLGAFGMIAVLRTSMILTNQGIGRTVFISFFCIFLLALATWIALLAARYRINVSNGEVH